MIKNPVALVRETGELIHISEYQRSEHIGDLICPSCKSLMIPKAIASGQVMSHFAHVNLGICYGYETVLHDWAKRRFTEFIGKKIVLPCIMDTVLTDKTIRKICRHICNEYVAYRKSREQNIREARVFVKGWQLTHYFTNTQGVEEWIKREFSIFTGVPYNELSISHEIEIQSAEVEVPVGGGVIADVILNGCYNIEIFVTHRVDDIKASRLTDIGLNTVEIDLSKSNRNFFSIDATDRLLLEDVSNKKVFGTFQDVRGKCYNVGEFDLPAFEAYLLEKAKGMLDNEYLEKKQIRDDETREIMCQLESDPWQFFFDYAVTKCLKVDFLKANEVDQKLKCLGFPIFDPTGKRQYEFPLEGHISEILSASDYNRLKTVATCTVFITAYKRTFELQLVFPKGEYRQSFASLPGTRFKSIRSGWHGPELVVA